jgi:hypothetical protein
LLSLDGDALHQLIVTITDGIIDFARERSTSASRTRIAATLGAGGG